MDIESELQNPNPEIYTGSKVIDMNRLMKERTSEDDEIDIEEIYDIIKNINDPEHPLTLEQLKVVSKDLISIKEMKGYKEIRVFFTPTIPNCSMSTLIGLLIKVKLVFSLPSTFKVVVLIEPGKHYTEDAINKQLQDKERVFAAYENDNVKKVLNKGIENDMDFEEYQSIML